MGQNSPNAHWPGMDDRHPGIWDSVCLHSAYRFNPLERGRAAATRFALGGGFGVIGRYRLRGREGRAPTLSRFAIRPVWSKRSDPSHLWRRIMQVLISGGGLAGLNAAYWLHKYGFTPVVLAEATKKNS